jgi:hypothetical protein
MNEFFDNAKTEMRVRRPLWMPLHTHIEGAGWKTNGFQHAVVAERERFKWTSACKRLVMATGHRTCADGAMDGVNFISNMSVTVGNDIV